jgi:Flp pilus assembly secretin CpaC/uncharacterized membrane protein YgcG
VKKNIFLIGFLLFVFFLSGCTTLSGKDVVIKHTENVEKTEQDVSEDKKENIFQNIKVHKKNYAVFDLVTKEQEQYEKADWLQRKITLKAFNNVSCDNILEAFREQSVNISTSLPLKNYIYNGQGLKNVTVHDALKIIFGSLGLDFKIKYDSSTIQVIPMKWETYYVNLGNRKTSFSSGGDSASSSGGGGSSSGSGAGSALAEAVDNRATTDTLIEMNIENDFWANLEKELENMISILVPVEREIENNDMDYDIPAILPNDSISYESFKQMTVKDDKSKKDSKKSAEMFEEITVGKVSINPDSGAVHLQVPHWLKSSFDEYFDSLNRQFNTQIHFDGRLYMVSKKDNESRGMNLNWFKTLFDKYDFAYSNNPLGGVTLNMDKKVLQYTDPNAGPLGNFGFQKQDGTLGVFNGFMSKLTNVSIIQRPSLVTTSGVPAKFEKYNTVYYNTINQTSTSSGSDSSSVGTENTLTPVKMGIKLVINPTYDPVKKLVRAQMVVEQMLYSGEQELSQYLSADNGNVTQIPLKIPLVTEALYSGEVLLNDGDLIIIGGQVDEKSQLTDSGIPKIKNVPYMAPFAGNKVHEQEDVVYYFALKVDFNKKR